MKQETIDKRIANLTRMISDCDTKIAEATARRAQYVAAIEQWRKRKPKEKKHHVRSNHYLNDIFDEINRKYDTPFDVDSYEEKVK